MTHILNAYKFSMFLETTVFASHLVLNAAHDTAEHDSVAFPDTETCAAHDDYQCPSVCSDAHKLIFAEVGKIRSSFHTQRHDVKRAYAHRDDGQSTRRDDRLRGSTVCSHLDFLPDCVRALKFDCDKNVGAFFSVLSRLLLGALVAHWLFEIGCTSWDGHPSD